MASVRSDSDPTVASGDPPLVDPEDEALPQPGAPPLGPSRGRPPTQHGTAPAIVDHANQASGVPPKMNSAVEGPSNLEERRAQAEVDRALIQAAKSGNQLAFRRLVERHQRRAFAIAFGMVRDENDARDLVQEAFLRVYRGLDRFQGDSSFFTWFYRIVTNLAIDFIRRPGRKEADHHDRTDKIDLSEEAEIPFVSRIDGAEPLDTLQRRRLGARLWAALEALPPYHRGVVLMREVEGMSYEEMAQAMNVSKGTIMSRLFHARQKLQRALADCYEEETQRAPRESSP
jgi:RNA polymerase sigma-70 factor (ECF subfamily)